MDKAKIIAQTSITAEKLRDPEFLIKYVRAGLPIEDYYAIRDLALLGLESVRPEVARIPAGWKLVPLVPTDEMEKAAAHEDNRYSNNRFTFASESRFFNVYCAMLRTAPEAPRALPLEEFEKHLRGEPSAVSPLARSQEET